MRRDIFFIAMVGGISLLAGCSFMSPMVKMERTTFGHPEEVIQGSGQAAGYWALADRRVFAVMAFLNAVGYDDEAPNAKMAPLRLKVRDMVAANLARCPEKLRQWRRYYHRNRRGSWQYADFALSLNTDYPFRRIRPNRELAYWDTPWDLRRLPGILNDFWATARLDHVWMDLGPQYAGQMGRYSPTRMVEQMDSLWQYLRMPRKDRRIIIHVPNPLQRHYTASGHRFEGYFYSIDGPGSSGGGLNIHEYLHTVINDLVREGYGVQRRKLSRYFAAGKDAPISASYQDPMDWTSECLVHALTHRVDFMQTSNLQARVAIEADVRSLTEGGFQLLGPLYAALADFENSGQPFDRYLAILFAKLPEYRNGPWSP